MRRQTILWLLPLAALLALFGYYFPLKVAQLRSVQSELRKTQGDVAELEDRLAAMAREREFLGTDEGLIHLARTKLGFVKTDEKKYVIETTPSPLPSATRKAP